VRVLTRRELGRALLARNLLLERSALDPLAAVRHLVGLQAQEPQEPWLGLLARLDGVDLTAASRLLEDRRLVRTHLMRRTVHLVTAEDCLALRPLHADVLLSRMRAVLTDRAAPREARPTRTGTARELTPFRHGSRPRRSTGAPRTGPCAAPRHPRGL